MPPKRTCAYTHNNQKEIVMAAWKSINFCCELENFNHKSKVSPSPIRLLSASCNRIYKTRKEKYFCRWLIPLEFQVFVVVVVNGDSSQELPINRRRERDARTLSYSDRCIKHVRLESVESVGSHLFRLYSRDIYIHTYTHTHVYIYVQSKEQSLGHVYKCICEQEFRVDVYTYNVQAWMRPRTTSSNFNSICCTHLRQSLKTAPKCFQLFVCALHRVDLYTYIYTYTLLLADFGKLLFEIVDKI